VTVYGPDPCDRPVAWPGVGGRTPSYHTGLGAAFLGDALDLLAELPSESVDLLVTSPPYALHFKKEYGNADKADYLEWLRPFGSQIHRVLKPEGSFVLNIGGSYNAGVPTRSLYHFKVLLMLCEEMGFHLAQEFFWHNPGKLPSPAEWVNVRRIRVKDSVEYIFWLSKEAFPKADNWAILIPYSKDMLRILERGYKPKVRPSGHNITNKFSDRGGSIPPNLLDDPGDAFSTFIEWGNNESNSAYLKLCQANGLKPHPARFSSVIPEFFIRFLTDETDLVVDPFAGSNVTGRAAETLNRRWLAFEMEPNYLAGSRLRFIDLLSNTSD